MKEDKCNHAPSKSDGKCRICGVQVYSGKCGVCLRSWKDCTCKFTEEVNHD